MSRRFVHAALVGKYQAAGIRPVLEDVAHFLVRQGLEVSLERQTALNTGMVDYDALDPAEIGQRCDLAVVVADADDARALWACGIDGITGPWASAQRPQSVS